MNRTLQQLCPIRCSSTYRIARRAKATPVLLELLRASSSFEIKLVSRARGYLREVLEPQKVDKLLKRPDLTYRDIALALEQSGAGGFSQLKALLQQQLGRNSSPENAELARLWLAADALDDAFRAKGLENELQELLHSRWGLGFPVETTLADWRQRAQRALLLHKFLHDWHGENLTSFARQSLPVGKAAEENALGLDLDQAQAPLPKAAAPVEAWLAYQAEIAHHVDGLQRRLEQQVAELSASEVEIAAGLEQLRGRYEALLEQQTQRFTDALQQGRPALDHTRRRGGPAAGRGTQFAVADVDSSPCSVVDGVPVGWSNDKTKRLVHLLQRVHTAVVISLIDLIRSKEAVLVEKLAGNGPLVVTSIGIDNAGERDIDDNLANVRTDMQRELDTIEDAVRRLAALPLEQPLERFVITADHGFLHLPLAGIEAHDAAAVVLQVVVGVLDRQLALAHPAHAREISPAAFWGQEALELLQFLAAAHEPRGAGGALREVVGGVRGKGGLWFGCLKDRLGDG